MIGLNSFALNWKRLAFPRAAIAIAVLLVAADASGDVQYSITDLGTLGGTYSTAHGINNSGQVVGGAYTSSNKVHAFLYSSSSGAVVDLGTLGGDESEAYGINDIGQVVGVADTSSTLGYHAFLYGGIGPMTDLGTFDGSSRSYSKAAGINNGGQVVGDANRAFSSGHAFLYSGATMQDLGTFGADFSRANDINNSGQIVGYANSQAFLYSGTGPVQFIGTLDGCSTSSASAINDHGQIVGMAADPSSHHHAFLYSDGTFQDLGTLGGSVVSASSINNSGQVVGYSTGFFPGNLEHAFLYNANGPMQDLNDLISPSSGWTLMQAHDINDNGQIVGFGKNPEGQTHAFLLTPVQQGPPQQPRLTHPSLPLTSENSSLVIYTHGWNMSADDFKSGDWAALDQALHANVPTGWDILGLDWTDSSGKLLQGQGPATALLNAYQQGTYVGRTILEGLRDGSYQYENIHLIAHSAGSALISRVAEIINDAGLGVTIHTTFLDPYAPTFLADVVNYGPLADWSDYYGKYSTWSDSYISADVLPFTYPLLANARNVDVTLLDPKLWIPIVGQTSHGWPVAFYANTVQDSQNGLYGGYGFARSQEGGGWDDRFLYPQGNSVPVVLPLNAVFNFVAQAVHIRVDTPLDVEGLTSNQTSSTGTVAMDGTAIEMVTGSPVWIVMEPDLSLPVNFLTFEAEFTSEPGAEGLLAVYWDNQVIGTLDERYIDPGVHGCYFDLPQIYEPGIYSLAFRLDPYTDVSSSVTIDNIRLGLLSVVPEPSSVTLMVFGAATLLAFGWRRRRVRTEVV